MRIDWFYSIIFCFIFGLLSCSVTKGKEIETKSINHFINESIERVEIDKLGNIFILDKENRFLKYNKEGVKQYEFIDKRYGAIFSFDVSNPLYILLFYKTQGMVRILDNTMSEIKQINLYNSGKFSAVASVCWTNDNQYWVYDQQLQRVFKVNDNLEVKAETNLFRDLGIEELNVNYMIERDNKLCIADFKKGIYLFDNFGQYLKYFKVNGIQDLQFLGKTFHKLIEGTLEVLDVNLPNINDTNINLENLKNVKSLRWHGGEWYYIFEDGLDKVRG